MSVLTNIFLHHSPLKPDVQPFMASLCAELTDEDIETIANADYGFCAKEYRAVLTDVRAAQAITYEQATLCHENLSLSCWLVNNTHLSAVPFAVPSGEAGEYRRAAFAAAALLSIPALGSPCGTEPSAASIRLLHIAIAMGPERAAQAGQLLAAVAANVGGSSFEDLPLWTGILVASLAADPSTGFRADAMARAMRLAVARATPGWYWYPDRTPPLEDLSGNIKRWWVLVNHFCLKTGPGCSAESARELRRLEAMFRESAVGW